MKTRIQHMTHGAIIAALYVALTHGQNMLFPGSASMAIQFRVSEALCVLAFFTPGAIPGLSLGCLLFNLTSGAALPLDFLIGTGASFLAALGMWCCRHRWPIPALLLPAVTNGLLVGWELSIVIGGGFWLNAVYVALGEAAVLLSLGLCLYLTLKKNRLHHRIFGN